MSAPASHSLPTQAAAAAGPPPLAAPWKALFDRLTGLSGQLRRQLAQQLEVQRLAEPHFHLLWACAQANDQGLPQGEVARAIELSPAQTSVLLEQVRQLHWVEGYRPTSDRRRQLWRLTPQGWHQLHQALRALEPWAARWEHLLAEVSRRHLECGLEALCQALGQGVPGNVAPEGRLPATATAADAAVMPHPHGPSVAASFQSAGGAA